MNQVSLRKVTVEDLTILKHWEAKPHVIFATGGDSDEEDTWLEEQLINPSQFVWIYIAELNSRPIGVVQIIDPELEETHYWGECEPNTRAIDIWIGEESDLGKGYGTQMMKQALDTCFSNPEVTKVLIDPLTINSRAIQFYKRLGFMFVEERMFDEDACSVYEITRAQWLKRFS